MPRTLTLRRPAALIALAALVAMPAVAEELTRPAYENMYVAFCPPERAEAEAPRLKCSRASILYPQYRDADWLNRLLTREVVVPVFVKAIGDDDILRAVGGRPTLEARYEQQLTRLVKGSESGKPLVEFDLRLTGTDLSRPNSQTSHPRPERFGPYLQFAFAWSLEKEESASAAPVLGGFVVVDTENQKMLTYDDLVAPAHKAVLAELQLQAFRVWLKQEQKLSDDDIAEHLANPSFAFHPSKNWRFAHGGLVFHFDMYEVGPRVFGTPEFLVAKDKLKGVVKPEILARIP